MRPPKSYLRVPSTKVLHASFYQRLEVARLMMLAAFDRQLGRAVSDETYRPALQARMAIAQIKYEWN